MSTAISLFDNPSLAVPDHLRDLNDDGNINDRISVPSLSFEGKTWSIVLNGEKTQLMKRDADGDEVPVAVMRVVVLDYNQRRGRALYEGAYDPAKASMPTCWSNDGYKPHESVPDPQCASCETCPMAVKGSRVSEQGKAVTACSQHRMVAVVPAHKMDMEPLRLKLAVTSDYDKENDLESKGWFAFQQYRDFLKARGINHTATLITKMRFDPGVAYPKVLFSPDRWVEVEEKKIINPLVKSDAVARLLAGTWVAAGTPEKPDTPAETKGSSAADDAIAAEAARVAKARQEEEAEAAAKAAAKAARAQAKADKEAAEAKAKADAEAAAAKEAAGKTTSTTTIIMDDDGDDLAVIPKKETASTDTPPADITVGDVPADVASLLADWDDDD